MRKTMLLMLLAVATGSAAAQWTEIRRNDQQTLYVVPATMRKVGDSVKLWALTDYGTAVASADKAYRSEIAQKEYDCKESRSRTLFRSAHPGNMGGGGAVEINAGPGSWGPVSPGSGDETLWKMACGTP